ncbi:MAG TPA: hypothetical protein PKA60_02415 [Candidatus Paceibacterota bacterium]|nr:hypothetical protein [Candidatus Paceibacterota bacterium]
MSITIPAIIRNDECLYEGNLIKYFQIIFSTAQNLSLPYHNFRHMFGMLWNGYDACRFYKGTASSIGMRNLLIGIMFHDYNHSGMLGDDDLNIARAIRGLKKHVLEEDKKNLEKIIQIIEATEFPHKNRTDRHLNLMEMIIRDADMMQVFDVSWIQHVIFGLSAEWAKTPLEILRMQESFLRGIKWNTTWAKEKIPQEKIEEKIKEVNNLLVIVRSAEVEKV